MAKQVAIEWDGKFARYVVAQVSGDRVKINRAGVVELAEEAGSNEDSAIEQITAALDKAGVKRSDAVVTVGRNGTEMRLLEVPYGTAVELPAMVRFQALRQLASMNEDWGLDYLTLNSPSEGETYRVLAVGVSPSLLQQVKGTCDKASLKLDKILFRPCSLGNLFELTLPSEETRLCVDTFGEEGELIVLKGNRFELVRNIRLARDQDGNLDPAHLTGEIRRTMMAYGNQTDSSPITQIVVCGTADDLRLAEAIHESLQVDATVFDPFQAVEVAGGALDSLGEHRRYFAGLIGSLFQEAVGRDRAIDFLNPRKPPVEESDNRQNILIGAAVGTILLAVCGYFGFEIFTKGSTASRLEKEVAARRDQHQANLDRLAELEDIEEYVGLTELNWLAELEQVSRQLPKEDVDINLVSFNHAFQQRGDSTPQITISGSTEDSQVIPKLEKDLMQDERLIVRTLSNDYIPEEGIRKFGVVIRVNELFQNEDSQESTDDQEDDSADGE